MVGKMAEASKDEVLAFYKKNPSRKKLLLDFIDRFEEKEINRQKSNENTKQSANNLTRVIPSDANTESPRKRNRSQISPTPAQATTSVHS